MKNHIALFQAIQRQDLKMIKLLVQNGANLEFIHPQTQLTPLATALNQGIEATKYILDLGADPNGRIPAIHNGTPLMYLWSNPGFQKELNSFALTKVLLSDGADPRLVDVEGNTVVHYVQRNLYEDELVLWSYMEQHGFPIFQANHKNRRPYHHEYVHFDNFFDSFFEGKQIPVHAPDLPDLASFLELSKGSYLPNRAYLHPNQEELVVDLPYGRLLKWRYDPHIQKLQELQTRFYQISRLVLSQDGETFAVLSFDLSGIRIMDYGTLHTRYHIYIQPDAQHSLEDRYLLTFTPDSKYLLIYTFTDDEYLQLYKVETGKLVWQVDLNELQSHRHSDEDPWNVQYLLYSPMGDRLCMVLDSHMEYFVLEFPVSDGRIVAPESRLLFYPRSSFRVWDGCYSLDGRKLAFLTNKNQIEVIDLEMEKCNSRTISLEFDTSGWKEDQKLALRDSFFGVEESTYSGQILLGYTELACTLPGCEIVIFDLDRCTLQRRLKLTGSKILAIDYHPTIPNKIRVATDEVLELVDLY